MTGARGGIGAALVDALRADHCFVFACSRSERVESSERASDGMQSIALDLDRLESVRRAAGRIARAEREIDLLIHCAGVTELPDYEGSAVRGPLADLVPEAVETMFRIHVTGPAALCAGLSTRLAPGARLVFISSDRASIALNSGPGSIGYAVTRAAQNMLARKLAAELPQIVLSIHPGWVRTRIGGARATLAPSESASYLLDIVGRAPPDMSGSFLNHLGEPLPW